MTMTISGSGTITGLSAGGLPSATVTQTTLATPVGGTGPAFYVYNAGTQSISSGVYTKVQFPSEGFDTNNNFDNVTNYRFTPTVAGYYQLNAGVYFSGTGTILLPLYKNGSLFMESSRISSASAGNTLNFGGLVYANGSTDYFEIYAYSSSGGSLGSGLALFFWFTGSMVRAG